MKLLICLVGLILLFEGIPYFASPKKMKQWMQQITQVPDGRLRVMGFAAMCGGLLLVYLSRQ